MSIADPGPVRSAVIGAGHFGRYHADKYAALAAAELVAICDVDAARAGAVAAKHGAEAVADYRNLVGRVDAVSIAVPTKQHFEVAAFFLGHGVHVLLEKPITDNLADADRLVALGRQRQVVFQIGHLERFVAEELGLLRTVSRPLYIECTRIMPFRNRGTDVGVVLDLMIHDIDLVLTLVSAEVTHVDALGAPILSRDEDIVSTRLRFANGCVTTITASRISDKAERKIRIFQPDSYISADLQSYKMHHVRRTGDGQAALPGFKIEEGGGEPGDPLAREVEAFIAAIRNRRDPPVTGEDGRRALAVAQRITASLNEHLALVSREFGLELRPHR